MFVCVCLRESQNLKEKDGSVYVILTGLALMILKAGTTKTVTARNVNVSRPKSLTTSIALATSSAAYTRDLSQVASLLLEKQNPLQLDTEENKKDVSSKRYPETKEL
jgi:NAD/NADP transhydrogenase alpha subunit